MSVRGLGDRWLAGESVPGVTFARHDQVRITTGAREGALGVIGLLVALEPEPQYFVELREGGSIRVRQSRLARVDGAA